MSEFLQAVAQVINSIIELLAIFPILAIIAFVIFITGANLIFVSYGGKNTIRICDTSEFDKQIARRGGIIFVIASLLLFVIYFLRKFFPTFPNQDPFFIYYFISTVLFVTLISLIAISNSRESTKIEAFRLTFILTGSLVTLTVFWRAIGIYRYLIESHENSHVKIPFGLCSQANFIPYFIILGIGVITAFFMIFMTIKNSNYRIIFRYIFLCIYLLFCRVLWEIIDTFAQVKIDNC